MTLLSKISQVFERRIANELGNCGDVAQGAKQLSDEE